MRKVASVISASFLISAGTWCAETAVINKTQYKSERVAPGPDQVLRLKKVFLFPSVDDVSGVLAPKLDEKLVALFRGDTRFELVRDPMVIKALSPDEAAYSKVAQNAGVHKEAASVTGADTTVLLRTKNVGTSTEMSLEFREASGELLYSETGTVPGYSSMDARWNLIANLFEAVLKKIPFEGTVTGRTANTLTIDLGQRKIKQGDVIEVARLVSIQRHPLLKTVVGTDYVRVGSAKVTTVDRVLSFAEVVEESNGEYIAPGQKVISIKKREGEAPVSSKITSEESKEPKKEAMPSFSDEVLKGDFDRPKARYGQVGVNLRYGSITHSQTVSGGSSEVSGSGLGVDFDGEFWITRNWIAGLYYGFQNADLSGEGVSSLDSSWKRGEGFVGYRFFPTGIGEMAALTGSLGYQSMKFDIPTVAASSIGAKTYAGVLVRADASIQFLPRNSVSTGFSFQPFSSVTEGGAGLGTADGGTVVGFHLSWNYEFADNLKLRVGLQYDSASANYTNNASSSDKRFAIGPGLYYSF